MARDHPISGPDGGPDGGPQMGSSRGPSQMEEILDRGVRMGVPKWVHIGGPDGGPDGGPRDRRIPAVGDYTWHRGLAHVVVLLIINNNT